MIKIACVGEALIDFINEAKDGKTFTKNVGGAPLNACIAMQKFNTEPYFIGSVGNDMFGQHIGTFMKEHHLNTKHLNIETIPTTLAFVSLDNNNEREFSFVRGADKCLKVIDEKEFLEFSHLHLGSATGFIGEMYDAYHSYLKLAMKFNVTISFDPNYRIDLVEDLEDFRSKAKYFIECANIVKLSDEEAMIIYEKDLESSIEVLKKFENKIVLITVGSKGTYVISNGECTLISSIEVKPKDTTGAGDAFIGVFIASYLNGESLFESVKLANIAGALTTESIGAICDSVNLKEVISNLNEKDVK